MNDMNCFNKSMVLALCVAGIGCRSNAASSTQEEKVPAVPRFSLDYRDTSVEPAADFYRYAAGTWIKNNPVPADKSRWTSFILLQERNWYLIHQILDSTTNDAGHFQAPTRQVSDFFLSAMDTNRLNQLGFKPIQPALAQINAVKSPTELLALVSQFHQRGIGGCFGLSIRPDATNSALYALSLRQGGLSLPDRDYYLSENFAKQRAAYAVHVEKMFGLLGEAPAAARSHAATVLDLETALAKTSKSRVALRDPIANYHKMTVASLVTSYPDLPLGAYLTGLRQQSLTELVVGQPEFLAALGTQLKDRPLDDWSSLSSASASSAWNGCPSRPKPRRWPSSPGSPKRSGTRNSSAITPRSRFGPMTFWATSSGPSCLIPGASWAAWASRWTAPNGT